MWYFSFHTGRMKVLKQISRIQGRVYRKLGIKAYVYSLGGNSVKFINIKSIGRIE